METLDNVVLFLHIVFGAAFATAVLLMQLVVGPAMSKLSPGEEKQNASKVIQKRAQRAIDVVIVVMTVTAIYLAITRWDIIVGEHLLHIKITFGITALIVANLLHFYFRGKKNRLKAAGKEEAFLALSRKTLFLEKFVLISVPAAFLLGVTFNHF